MMKPMRKTNMPLRPLNYATTDLPAAPNLSYMWNGGSLLGLCLLVQIITGLLLAMHYAPTVLTSFSCVTHIMHDTKMGWFMRYTHANGASVFFMIMYMHMARGIFFKSYKATHVWASGVTIFIMTMATAFMGYLLPWGQMSFWGATVITNLVSALPYVGYNLVEWLWGGYSVNNATLNRFFALHFMLPMMMMILVGGHLMFLHEVGSSNPLGISSDVMKIPFHLYYTYKDLMGFIMTVASLMTICHYIPNNLGDPENFCSANPLVTPTHIKPEWYFLWAYAILRSIPNKGGGVMAMALAILFLYLGPLNKTNKSSINHKLLSIVLFISLLLLTWVGGSPVETPYEKTGFWVSATYFSTLLTLMMLN